ncbi:MAG: type II toxin-antitoxin system RelE/ParE family toxin [Patescibacteria group bacterium]
MSGQFRFRVGDYRLLFNITENKIIIHAVGHRKNIYKK